MSVTVETAPSRTVPPRTTAGAGLGGTATARVARPGVRPVAHRAAAPRVRVVAGGASCAAPAESIAASSTVQLTRRGWAVLLGLATVVAAVLVALAALSHPASGDTGAAAADPVAAGPVVVRAGDTLWSIAERVAPGRDPRAVVFDLQQVNHLTDPTVVEGQVLQVR